MPCYSIVTTNLIHVKFMEAAAKKLGMSFVVKGKNEVHIALSSGTEVRLTRIDEGDKFYVSGRYSYGDFQANILTQLTAAYGKEVLKAWATKNNYVLSPGAEAGAFVLIQR